MHFRVIGFVLIVAGVVRAEPPVPQYGPPGGALGAPISSYGTPNYNAHGDHDHSAPKSYEFGYQVKDDYSGNNYNRQEVSDGNQVKGEYRVQLPDGRTQIVTYWADWQTGFHADVRYEGEAVYPETYNTGNNHYGQGSHSGSGYQYSEPNNQYSAPSSYNNDYNSGYNAPATSSVSIKDYSGPGTPYKTGDSHYSSGLSDFNNAFEGYSNPSFGNKIKPVYGAP